LLKNPADVGKLQELIWCCSAKSPEVKARSNGGKEQRICTSKCDVSCWFWMWAV